MFQPIIAGDSILIEFIAGISRYIVQCLFESFADTLIAFWLPAWKLKLATKHVQQSKIYMIDYGLVCANPYWRFALSSNIGKTGTLLEIWILHEFVPIWNIQADTVDSIYDAVVKP